MLRECRLALTFIILGGAFNAYVNLFYMHSSLCRSRNEFFLGYVGVTAAALLISSPCVRAAGLLGGSLSYLLFDGGTDCLLWTDVACDVPETGTRDIELV